MGDKVIIEAREVVAGGPLHGTTLLSADPDTTLGGLTLPQALAALSARAGCKYKVLRWQGDTYLTPCGGTVDEIEVAEGQPRYRVVLARPVCVHVLSGASGYTSDKTHSGGDKMFITCSQAAKLLGVHPVTLRRRVWSGKLPHYRVGSRILFERDELLRTFRVEHK